MPRYQKMVGPCNNVVSQVKIEKEYNINPETRRKQVVDAKFIIYPSRGFTQEQMKSNAHTNRIDSAVVGDNNLPILEPRKGDYKTLGEYEKARREYLKGQ